MWGATTEYNYVVFFSELIIDIENDLNNLEYCTPPKIQHFCCFCEKTTQNRLKKNDTKPVMTDMSGMRPLQLPASLPSVPGARGGSCPRRRAIRCLTCIGQIPLLLGGCALSWPDTAAPCQIQHTRKNNTNTSK